MGSGERPPDRPAGLFAGLTRNVVVLSWVSFFQDAASEMLYPVLPLFLTGVLGAPASVVGLIEGVAEGTASVMKAVSGRLADIRRRRPLVATGYGISSISKLVIGFATGWPLVLVARFADRFGKGLRTTPRDALIAADTPPELRGHAFGFHRAMDSAGAVVGPLLGMGLGAAPVLRGVHGADRWGQQGLGGGPSAGGPDGNGTGGLLWPHGKCGA